MINVTHYIDRIKDKNHTTISVDAKKALDKIQHSFMIRTLTQLGIGNFPIPTKEVYKKQVADTALNGESLVAFPLRSGTRQGCLLSQLLFNIVLEALARAILGKKKK